MKYIKTAIATNTDIDNSNVVIDLTGEDCPKFVATGKKNPLQSSSRAFVLCFMIIQISYSRETPAKFLIIIYKYTSHSLLYN